MGLPNIGPVELAILIAGVVGVAILVVLRMNPGGEAAKRVPPAMIGEDIIVRTFRANSPASAARWYQEDLSDLVDHGYLPVTQTWQPGEWRSGAFVAALLLLFVGIGVLVFLYLVVMRPPGTMIVTYVRRDLLPGSLTGAR
jgi:hypothetical protein